MKTMAVAATVLVLSGCAALRDPPPVRWVQFDEVEYAPYAKKGDATLTGQAFLMTRGGEARKAAGRVVTLDPATTLGQQWWNERRFWIQGGFPTDSRFLEARRTTTADADGRFRFEQLPPGTYFVRTIVRWEAPCVDCIGGTSVQGGNLGAKVEISRGEKKEVILSRELIDEARQAR